MQKKELKTRTWQEWSMIKAMLQHAVMIQCVSQNTAPEPLSKHYTGQHTSENIIEGTNITS